MKNEAAEKFVKEVARSVIDFMFEDGASHLSHEVSTDDVKDHLIPYFDKFIRDSQPVNHGVVEALEDIKARFQFIAAMTGDRVDAHKAAIGGFNVVEQALASGTTCRCGDELADQLLKTVEEFITDNKITCNETIGQCDWVSDNTSDFIEKLCEIVGYAALAEEEK